MGKVENSKSFIIRIKSTSPCYKIRKRNKGKKVEKRPRDVMWKSFWLSMSYLA